MFDWLELFISNEELYADADDADESDDSNDDSKGIAPDVEELIKLYWSFFIGIT